MLRLTKIVQQSLKLNYIAFVSNALKYSVTCEPGAVLYSLFIAIIELFKDRCMA